MFWASLLLLLTTVGPLRRVPYNACDGLDDDLFVVASTETARACRDVCARDPLCRACVFDLLHRTCAVYGEECRPVRTSFRPPGVMFVHR